VPIQLLSLGPAAVTRNHDSHADRFQRLTCRYANFNPRGGPTPRQSVMIGDTTPGATIYYTTDNTTPTTSSNVYSVPIAVSSSETIHAIAWPMNIRRAPRQQQRYTVNIPVAATPAFSLASGTYAAAQTVTISDTIPRDDLLHHRWNGANGQFAGVHNSDPLSSSAIIQAIAIASNYLNSTVATADYTIWQASATEDWPGWVGRRPSTRRLRHAGNTRIGKHAF